MSNKCIRDSFNIFLVVTLGTFFQSRKSLQPELWAWVGSTGMRNTGRKKRQIITDKWELTELPKSLNVA